ncbi:Zinc finger CCCH-type antiviral 1 [Gossypium arboreum]|uniref:Zinc finger CCCH-type antiviral 1 n=1 Tax=Gossypium arboreum TaxID=29729 RepID=A0A0B0MKC4_GOSAR|nr:Zinc finger CCCH-type antiviral 1 [Gossypium arboreum]
MSKASITLLPEAFGHVPHTALDTFMCLDHVKSGHTYWLNTDTRHAHVPWPWSKLTWITWLATRPCALAVFEIDLKL